MALRFYTERIDASRLQRTPAGMVRVDATVSKPGVYSYRRADGTTVREYLPPEEVTKADSLATIEDATVTNRHPGSMVDPASWKDVAIGHARNGRAEGARAVATLVINRADAQSKIGSELVEVSRGVNVRLDPTPGVTPEGEKYDAVQRDVVYNHIAVGPPGWGRQGADVAMRLDAKDDEVTPCCSDCASRADEHLPWDECMAKAMKEYGDKETAQKVCGEIKAKNDGYPMKYTDPKTKIVHEFKSDSELSEFIAAQRADAAACAEPDEDDAKAKKMDEALKAEKARADAAQAKADAYEARERAATRAALETRAKAVLGAAHKFDSADTDRAVQLAALAKLTPTVKYDGQSDAYVAAAFDIAISTAPKAGQSRSDAMAAGLHGVDLSGQRHDANSGNASSGDEGPRLDARERMIKANAERHAKPLSFAVKN